jgi:hypothetical protein
MKGEPMNESKKRDRLSPGYKEIARPDDGRDARQASRVFAGVRATLSRSKKQAVAKTQPSSFGILSAPKVIHQVEKKGLG